MEWLKGKLHLIQSERYRYRKNCYSPSPMLVSFLVSRDIGGISGKIVQSHPLSHIPPCLFLSMCPGLPEVDLAKH